LFAGDLKRKKTLNSNDHKPNWIIEVIKTRDVGNISKYQYFFSLKKYYHRDIFWAKKDDFDDIFV